MLKALGAGSGVVHWSPPAAALDVAEQRLREPGLSAYGPCAGMPALVAALKAKLAAENGLAHVRAAALMQRATQPSVSPGNTCMRALKTSCVPLQHEVMVTSGANQAFTNIVLTLVDPTQPHSASELRWLPQTRHMPTQLVILIAHVCLLLADGPNGLSDPVCPVLLQPPHGHTDDRRRSQCGVWRV